MITNSVECKAKMWFLLFVIPLRALPGYIVWYTAWFACGTFASHNYMKIIQKRGSWKYLKQFTPSILLYAYRSI
jgi:hypothetical protein